QREHDVQVGRREGLLRRCNQSFHRCSFPLRWRNPTVAPPEPPKQGFTMQLFFAPAACSQAVHIALREAGLSYDLRKVDLATDKLAVRFAELDALFGRQAHIAGDAFTVADAYAFTILSWAPMVGTSLKPYPQLQAYLQRIAQRPAVRAALDAEGLQRA